MSTTSPITKQQSIPTMEAPTSLAFSPQLPQSPLEPLSPLSPSSAGSGMCSPLSLQSPVHDSTDALSARNEGSTEEVCAYQGYIARRSAVLKRWKDRKFITVITGMLFVHAYVHWEYCCGGTAALFSLTSVTISIGGALSTVYYYRTLGRS